MRRLIASILVAWLSASCAVAAVDSPIYTAWNSDKAIVIVINADQTSSSETYADWSYYLNAFSEEHSGTYLFAHLEEADVMDIPEEMKKPYTLLFFKKGQPSYITSTPVLEPQTYEFVHAVYSGDVVESHLRQFAPSEVKVTWGAADRKFVVTPLR